VWAIVDAAMRSVAPRLWLLLLTVVLASVVGVLPAQAATRLVAKVGPGSSISLRTASGRPVAKLAAGAYVIVVKDRSRAQNFDLKGPAASSSRKTALRFKGVVTWRLQLAPGKYHFFSDGRPTFRSAFRVV
jgi:hypothetical protein